MTEATDYSVKSVHDALLKTFHQYLRAQYHIWDEALIAERDRILSEPGATHQEPRLEATAAYRGGPAYATLPIPDPAKRALDICASNPKTGIPRRPYQHQAEAIQAFLATKDDLIVATGTGSGKTESFLMPIIGQLAIESQQRAASWLQPGVRALLLYPMNALVNDQLGRLRRLFGSDEVAEFLRGARPYMPTFGMYTSRTPYPGQGNAEKDRQRVVEMLGRLYPRTMSIDVRRRLDEEGKLPAKDIPLFVDRLVTDAKDREMLTRQEMQARSPDLLVTNYSMLEYMMLRPIEANIFDQTRSWLANDRSNCLTIVLDEAHMYRGSAGAEVAYLLRRLRARLGATEDQLRYILTSASLGSSEEARDEIKAFAKKLTGGAGKQVTLVSGTLEERPVGAVASEREQEALSQFNFEVLHRVESDPALVSDEIDRLCTKLGISANPPDQNPRERAYKALADQPVAWLIANRIMSRPTSLKSLAEECFPNNGESGRALEAALALMSFAREPGTGRPFAPVRSHLFFRGLPGLYACTNVKCSEAVQGGSAVLGRLFSTPRLRCECGARVYELLTHRACGAAYLRGYLTDSAGDFLWHEPSSGVWTDKKLTEAQFYVVPEGEEAPADVRCWLRTKTGELLNSKPADAEPGEYLCAVRPTKPCIDRGRSVWTIRTDCPACDQSSSSAPKAMDLATKGEAPFAHLVRTQVSTQPMLKAPSLKSPNGGRKALLFSDGRQKAARLARDIPREIEQDVFRQLLILSATQLSAISEEPALSGRMYASFLKALASNGLRLFDGEDRDKIDNHLEQFERIFESDLKDAMDQFGSAPSRYSALLLRQLCSPHYSISALTLGYVMPSKYGMRMLRSKLPGMSDEDITSIAVTWTQRMLTKYAFDSEIISGVRFDAAGHPTDLCTARDGFSDKHRALLASKGLDSVAIETALAESLCDSSAGSGTCILPKQVKLKVAFDAEWHQCESCKAVRPTALWGNCSNCTRPDIRLATTDSTSYLRARKGFWRDPVVRIIEESVRPLNIAVEEHSAQLSYKDVEAPTTTTETYERRFKDILLDDESSIDVLSCTTTMEVGIDIGSLIAVGMRNVPPMRQNYQQRAGRAGRRGSAVSTVMTYAQNGAHDAYYFDNPDRIISGDPPRPILDTGNRRIAERHVHAQLVQDFFRPRAASSGGDIFTALGDTWKFYTGDGATSLRAFGEWVRTSSDAATSIREAANWLPDDMAADAAAIARDFLKMLEEKRPAEREGLEESLIEFLFGKGLLPSYAFPRDLCALQIQQQKRTDRGTSVQIVEQPQQGLNVALSEYAPGRLVVVNKKTYRIGTVAAAGSVARQDRAIPLFDERKNYIHCEECQFTAGFSASESVITECPHCGVNDMRSVTVIQPEVVFPRGKKAVDEFDDEQAFSQATTAQLPLSSGENPANTSTFGANCLVMFERAQQLVMVNKGSSGGSGDGFMVCERCGYVLLEGEQEGPHERDYYIQSFGGRKSSRCNGSFKHVYLGYSFTSDVLIARVAIHGNLRFDFRDRRKRKPIEDALQSLSDALVLSMGRVLDIDSREVAAGYRFASVGGENFADIYLYDTLSGGAGYAFQAGERFEEIFSEAERLLVGCNCGSSCENCLRHYGNRFNHASLDRSLAWDLASYIRSGALPDAMPLDVQRSHLAPLSEMLAMAGWSIADGIAVKAGLGSVRVDIAVCPSLVDCEPRMSENGVRRFTFTPYELSRDLPSAFAELS